MAYRRKGEPAGNGQAPAPYDENPNHIVYRKVSGSECLLLRVLYSFRQINTLERQEASNGYFRMEYCFSGGLEAPGNFLNIFHAFPFSNTQIQRRNFGGSHSYFLDIFPE